MCTGPFLGKYDRALHKIRRAFFNKRLGVLLRLLSGLRGEILFQSLHVVEVKLHHAVDRQGVIFDGLARR